VIGKEVNESDDAEVVSQNRTATKKPAVLPSSNSNKLPSKPYEPLQSKYGNLQNDIAKNAKVAVPQLKVTTPDPKVANSGMTTGKVKEADGGSDIGPESLLPVE